MADEVAGKKTRKFALFWPIIRGEVLKRLVLLILFVLINLHLNLVEFSPTPFRIFNANKWSWLTHFFLSTSKYLWSNLLFRMKTDQAAVTKLLQQWDHGSKSVRSKILQDFVASNQGKTGPELELEFAHAASLFLTRLTAWLRLTYPFHLYPIRLFILRKGERSFFSPDPWKRDYPRATCMCLNNTGMEHFISTPPPPPPTIEGTF